MGAGANGRVCGGLLRWYYEGGPQPERLPADEAQGKASEHGRTLLPKVAIVRPWTTL